MLRTVDLAIIGCGGITGAHLRRYRELHAAGESRFRIVATVDNALPRAKSFAADIASNQAGRFTPTSPLPTSSTVDTRLTAPTFAGPTVFTTSSRANS